MTLDLQVPSMKEARKVRREGRKVGRIAARDDSTAYTYNLPSVNVTGSTSVILDKFPHILHERLTIMAPQFKHPLDTLSI